MICRQCGIETDDIQSSRHNAGDGSRQLSAEMKTAPNRILPADDRTGLCELCWEIETTAPLSLCAHCRHPKEWKPRAHQQPFCWVCIELHDAAYLNEYMRMQQLAYFHDLGEAGKQWELEPCLDPFYGLAEVV